jgi:hypothetical protein
MSLQIIYNEIFYLGYLKRIKRFSSLKRKGTFINILLLTILKFKSNGEPLLYLEAGGRNMPTVQE